MWSEVVEPDMYSKLTFFDLPDLVLLHLQLFRSLASAKDCLFPADTSLMLLQLALYDTDSLKLPLYVLRADNGTRLQSLEHVEQD